MNEENDNPTEEDEEPQPAVSSPAPDADGEGGEGGEDVADEDEDRDPFDDLPGGVRDRLEAFIPDLVRRTFAAGLGALFTTEEGIRKLTKDMPMPKEVAGYLATTAGATKDEVLRIVAGEVREFLGTVNLSDEIAKMLTTLSFEVKTEIRFIPNDEKYGGVEPDVKAKVRVKRNDKKERGGRFRRRTTALEDDES